jgi:hypothetical protein
MKYTEIVSNESQFQALTSLTPLEFDYLLSPFSHRWGQYYRYHTLDGRARTHPRSREHGNATLRGTEQKLFFLLVYLKTNSLQEHQAASFGVSQSKVSRIVRVLLKVLNQALEDLKLIPVRNGSELRQSLSTHQDKIFSYDGTDRSVQRADNQEAQRQCYSGKHRRHTTKNLTLCDDQQYIHYLSPSCPGREHDKAIADEFPIELPQRSVLRQDLGFIGHAPDGITIEQPHKKPKNKELSFSQKLYNQMLAGTRIVVEHANSGIKRLRIVKETIRIHAPEIRDLLMKIACALHNLRVRSPQRAYS